MRVSRVLLVLSLLLRAPALLAQTGPVGPPAASGEAAAPRGASAAMVLPASLGGLFLVRDLMHRSVLEVWKKPGQLLVVGLAPGRYVVHRNLEGVISQASVTLQAEERTQLSAGSFGPLVPPTPAPVRLRTTSPAPRGPGQAKGTSASMPPPRVVLPVAIGLLPRDLSTNAWLAEERPVTNALALGVVNGGTALHGLGLGLAGNAYEEEARGVLLAGGVNTVSHDMAGLQVAGLVNIVEGRLSGLQVTPGTNVAEGGMRGLQVAGFGNGTEQLHGLQLALGGMNHAGDGVWGVQLAGLGANDAEDVHGLQLAGIGNTSRSLAGVQVALVNVSGDVTGAQVGLINVADTVRGTQLGLLNFAKVMKGVPLGPLSFEEGAPFHLETWASDIQLLNVGVKFGGRSTYTTLLAGLGPDDRLQRYSLGVGFGGRKSLGERFWLELDVAGSVVRLRGQPLLGGANVLGQGRLMLGLQLFKHLALFAGPTYNTYFSWSEEDRHAPTTRPVRLYQVDPDITLQHWPGLQFGLRI